jgi:hypothetical protein
MEEEKTSFKPLPGNRGLSSRWAVIFAVQYLQSSVYQLRVCLVIFNFPIDVVIIPSSISIRTGPLGHTRRCLERIRLVSTGISVCKITPSPSFIIRKATEGFKCNYPIYPLRRMV